MTTTSAFPSAASGQPDSLAASSSGWDDVVAIALVGTERRPAPGSILRGQVVLDTLADSAEARLLAAAALLAPYRTAGWRPPVSDAELPEPAHPETRPPASAAAVHLLELLITGTVGGSARNGLLGEWLERCGAAGQRVPPQHLPGLLEHLSTNAALQPRAMLVLGTTGRWLAERNPAWHWALTSAEPAAADVEDSWRTGTSQQRVAALRVLRRHNPAAGLALLQSTWRSEAAADRATFIDALSAGLDDADEPFLEAALDDRAAGVRRAAAAALTRLPDSAFARRMTARAVPLVSRHGRVRHTYRVDLPAEPDESARRDGVTSGRAAGSSGRTRELLAILAATPLSMWPRRFGASPADLVRGARDEHLLIDGWRRAAAAQQDPEWARALLAHQWSWDLVQVLPPDERARQVAVACGDEAVDDEAVAGMLTSLPVPWSQQLTTAVLDRATRRAAALRKPTAARATASSMAALLHPAALGMAPEAAGQVESWLRSSGVSLAAARDLLHALMLRSALAKEFA